MSNANSENRGQDHDELVRALRGMGHSDESEVGDETQVTPEADPEENSEGMPSPAASGFVGMLAKEGREKNLDASEHMEAKSAEGEGGQPLKATDQIYMAREIKPAASAAAVRARMARGAPGWYHAAVPVMYTLGSLLILIGFWAVGALIYMAVKKPAGPGYPLISWEPGLEEGEGAYTKMSWVMAWVMMACLPVSLALGMMAGMMQRAIRAGNKRSGVK